MTKLLIAVGLCLLTAKAHCQIISGPLQGPVTDSVSGVAASVGESGPYVSLPNFPSGMIGWKPAPSGGGGNCTVGKVDQSQACQSMMMAVLNQ